MIMYSVVWKNRDLGKLEIAMESSQSKADSRANKLRPNPLFDRDFGARIIPVEFGTKGEFMEWFNGQQFLRQVT